MEKNGRMMSHLQAIEAFMEFKGVELEKSTQFDVDKLCNWLAKS
jgi:hypothetical protein